MVTLLIFIFVLVDTTVVLLAIVLFALALVVWLQSPFLGVAALSAEPSGLSLPHLVEVAATALIILKNLVFLVFGVLRLQLLDNVVGLLAPLNILQIVHVQLMLKVVNVGVLLNIDVVEPLQLLLKSLVLLLILRLHILDALQTLLSSFELRAPAFDLVCQLSFILFELLDRIDHLAHFALLRVNNVADALLDVLLL